MPEKKVLITEDSPTILAMLVEIVSSEGYEVITAEDGMEALNTARRENPDLVILDLMLPKLDGYKVCRMLKFDRTHRDTPILMLTARSGENDRAMGEQVGADDYLVKPFDPEVLLEHVNALLGKAHTPAQPAD